MYNKDDCPNLTCSLCKHFEKDCSRVNENLEFYRPWFLCRSGEKHIICRDFEPLMNYKDLENWTNYDDWLEVYKKVWWDDKMPLYCSFFINKDHTVCYKVPMQLFIDGTMIQGNELKACIKEYYKKTREGFGSKLVKEKISGAKLNGC